MKTLCALLPVLGLLVTGALPFPAFAADGAEGHGGDLLILPDDRVILADPFVRVPGKKTELHPAVIQELKRVETLLKYLGETSKFVAENVLSPYVEYMFTDDPLDCARVQTGTLPSGSSKFLGACTQGPLTLIAETPFKRMSIREQAKLIVHERLRALKVAAPGRYIADVTDAIEIGLEVTNLRARKERIFLDENQIEKLKLLMLRIIQLEMGYTYRSTEQNWTFFPNGGALVSRDSEIDPSAYVEFGSKLEKSAIGEEASVYALSCHSCRLGIGSKVDLRETPHTSTPVKHLAIGNGSEIQEGTIWDNVTVLDSTRILRSNIRGKIGSRVFMEESTLAGVASDDVKIEHSTVGGTIGARSHILRSTVNDGFCDFGGSAIGESAIGADSVIQDSTIRRIAAGDGTRITNSNADCLSMRANGTLQSSHVRGVLTAGQELKLSNATVAGEVLAGNKLEISDSTLSTEQTDKSRRKIQAILGDGTKITQSRLSFDAITVLIGKNVRLHALDAPLRSEFSEGKFFGALFGMGIPAIAVTLPGWILTPELMKKGFDKTIRVMIDNLTDSRIVIPDSVTLKGNGQPTCPAGEVALKSGPYEITKLKHITKRCMKDE